MEIFDSHDSFNNKHGIKVEEDFKNLPSIHWLPKVYKKPYKFRYIGNSRSCSTKELSIRMALVLQAIKSHVKKYCLKVYENSGVNLFWSIDNSLEVINAIKSKRYTVSEINTFDFSTLYTSLPLHLVNTKLMDLWKRLLQGKTRPLLLLVRIRPLSLIINIIFVYIGHVKIFVIYFVFFLIVLLLSSGWIYIYI